MGRDDAGWIVSCSSRHSSAQPLYQDIERGVIVSPMEVHAVAHRIRGEFIEMPGLLLTPPQAARLWDLDLPVCRTVIDLLVGAAFLRWTAAGAVTRAEG